MIKEITADATWPLRQEVMWPDKDMDYIRLPDDSNGRHYGYYVDHQLISVISLFEQSDSIQFRKFATANPHQGKGYGTQLLQHVLDSLVGTGHCRIWCNARIDKALFYEKFGLKKTATRFEKDGVSYVVMEKLL
ncbi:GCN5-related N-acetyltransferase [Fulvivirga imtechensis AK7]|uniref:GCN5-related N-acetyltransferase n=1 Tax=Fulvivirga imtechensis AK7 TaxID=1237149 RepID=L8JN89_9BACT|nr:GNAT family N-acetyltransferase [Fulvivirga imtechensis]ELR68827.1 GCN5-related N-acetyltransferase [Fulvivirga imtechensis AK7]